MHTNFFRTRTDHTSINCQKIRKFCKIFLYDTDPTKMSRLHRVAWLLIDLRQYNHILIYMHAYTYIKLIWPRYDTKGCYDVANVFSRFVTLFTSTIHHHYCYNDKETYLCIIYIRFENVRRHAHTPAEVVAETPQALHALSSLHHHLCHTSDMYAHVGIWTRGIVKAVSQQQW